MSKFFINRPIFAIVIAIMITLIGLLSMVNLPVARYPQISPPSVRVSTMYTGATPQVLNDTVASVIESQIVGVQDLDYMTSIVLVLVHILCHYSLIKVVIPIWIRLIPKTVCKRR